MRLEIYKDDTKLDFENSLLVDYFIKLNEKLDEFKPIALDFSDIHYLLNEQNKYLLELSFQHQKQESIDG